MEKIQVSKILDTIRQQIKDWHQEHENTEQNFTITEDMKQRCEMNARGDDFYEIVNNLIAIHTDIWHAEDQIRKSKDNRTIADLSRYIIQLNLCRTDCYEKLDKIIFEMASQAKESK